MPVNGRILVVDDEADTVSLVELTLGLAGYRVDAAMSGEQALQRMQEDRYDVVLLDIMMPQVSGFDVLARLRSDPQPPPPVIVLTAKGRNEDRERGKALGAFAYLIKPVTRGELLDTIQRAMGVTLDADAPT